MGTLAGNQPPARKNMDVDSVNNEGDREPDVEATGHKRRALSGSAALATHLSALPLGTKVTISSVFYVLRIEILRFRHRFRIAYGTFGHI